MFVDGRKWTKQFLFYIKNITVKVTDLDKSYKNFFSFIPEICKVISIRPFWVTVSSAEWQCRGNIGSSRRSKDARVIN